MIASLPERIKCEMVHIAAFSAMILAQISVIRVYQW